MLVALEFAGRNVSFSNYRLLRFHVAGDLHRFLRSDRSVLDVRGQKIGGRHSKNYRDKTHVVFQIQLVLHDSAFADGK